MGMLLAFAPFIVFVVLERFVGITAGLVSASVISVLLLLHDLIAHRKVKVLELGTLVLFGGLALYAKFADPNWSIIAVRLRVDAGLLLIVLVSLAIRRPFTLQYATEQVSQDLWSSPDFIRTNYLITAVWALAFTVMVIAEAAILYAPGLPTKVGVIITVAALYGAFRFTADYPKRRERARP